MKAIKYRKSILALAIAASPVILAANAAADALLEEIVVTAQKSAQSLDEVPIALTAFTGDFIKEAKLTDIKKLISLTPGLAGLSRSNYLDTISVRGVSTNAFGIGGDSSIGIYKDGVYYGRNGAAVTSFFDIERVEILKGPQGLLFGRNAASGAISTITQKPKLGEVEGYLTLGAGDHGRKQAEFAYNQPLNETWALRIAGVKSEEDGYVKNLYNDKTIGGHDRNALRLSIRNEAEWGDVTLTAEHEEREQYGSIYTAHVNGELITGDNRTAYSNFPGRDDADVSGVTITANIDLNETMALTSITGYSKHDWVYDEDYDGTPYEIIAYTADQSGEYYSQELRLNVAASDDLAWYVGASAYKENVSALLANQTGDTSAVFGPYAAYYDNLTETNETDGDYSGWAVYGDMTYQLTEKMDVSVGARYTMDKKQAETTIMGQGFVWPVYTPIPVKGKLDWDDLSPRATLRYFASDDTMFFGSVSKGYKAGGFGTDNVTKLADGVALPGAELDPFDPESIVSYEIGVKGDLAEGRVKYGISAYSYQYEDLQYVVVQLANSFVENVGEVDGVGVELDLRAAINDNWSLFMGAAWSDTDASGLPLETCEEPDGQSCEGNRLAFNPELTISGGVNATYPVDGGEIFGRLTFSWQDDYFSDMENKVLGTVDSGGFVNLVTGWNSSQNWRLSAYVENVFDEESFALITNGTISSKVGPTSPRTVGVDVSFRF
jgi:iron complex outermembrane receptor protein